MFFFTYGANKQQNRVDDILLRLSDTYRYYCTADSFNLIDQATFDKMCVWLCCSSNLLLYASLLTNSSL